MNFFAVLLLCPWSLQGQIFLPDHVTSRLPDSSILAAYHADGSMIIGSRSVAKLNSITLILLTPDGSCHRGTLHTYAYQGVPP